MLLFFAFIVIIHVPFVMLFILAYTFAVRQMAKPKPLVDNTLHVSPCYSSLNCINVSAFIRETVRLPHASSPANVSERRIAQPSVLRNAALIHLCCQFHESLCHAENFQLDIKGCEHHRRVIELPFPDLGECICSYYFANNASSEQITTPT